MGSGAHDFARAQEGIQIQHLLLGINAHINLDLGFAAGEIGRDLDDARFAAFVEDFNAVNTHLMELMEPVQELINSWSPAFRLVDELGGNLDEGLFGFSLRRARRSAHEVAETVRGARRTAFLETLVDKQTAGFGRLIVSPPLLRPVVQTVGMLESDDIAGFAVALDGLLGG